MQRRFIMQGCMRAWGVALFARPLAVSHARQLCPPALPCPAEVLLHVRPERLGALEQMNAGLEARLQQYAEVRAAQPALWLSLGVGACPPPPPGCRKELPVTLLGHCAFLLGCLPACHWLSKAPRLQRGDTQLEPAPPPAPPPPRAQAHGPLLHLHFLATLPGGQGVGLGRRVLRHLERMADAGKARAAPAGPCF